MKAILFYPCIKLWTLSSTHHLPPAYKSPLNLHDFQYVSYPGYREDKRLVSLGGKKKQPRQEKEEKNKTFNKLIITTEQQV